MSTTTTKQTRSSRLCTARQVRLYIASVIRKAHKSALLPDGSMSVKDAKDIASMAGELRAAIVAEDLEVRLEKIEADKKPTKLKEVSR